MVMVETTHHLHTLTESDKKSLKMDMKETKLLLITK